MKTKLLLSTLTLGLLAGAYVWQAQAQNNAPAPAGAQSYQYKVVVQPLPAQQVFSNGDHARMKLEATKPQEVQVLSNYPDWEIDHAELLAQYPGYTPPHGTYAAWPAMVYTLRKAK